MDRRLGCEGGGAIIGRTRRRSWTINIGRQLRAQNGRGEGKGGARPGKCNGYRPADDGPGNHRLPPPVGHRWTISRRRGVCARETAGSGRVSGAVATAVVIVRNDGRAVDQTVYSGVTRSSILASPFTLDLKLKKNIEVIKQKILWHQAVRLVICAH